MRKRRLLHRVWLLLRDTVVEFFNDNALSRGAALAYYTVFALAPILLIAIAAAGLVFGRAAAQGAVVTELSGLMGTESAQALQALLEGAFRHPGSGRLAFFIGIATFLITATGVFVELQTSLNAIWKVEPAGFTTGEILRSRLLSLGLIGALGFLLVVSLLFSAAVHAAGTWLDLITGRAQTILRLGNLVFSFALLVAMFAGIYKVLPDRHIHWSDVGMGSVVTALLFEIGKYAISLYIGSSAIASSYGSAGSVIVVLVWIYYSVQIFLLGAEFTKVWAFRRDEHEMART